MHLFQGGWLQFCRPSSFALPRENRAGATEVSITTPTLSAWPNGDERGWLFAKAGSIVFWAQWETEAKEVQIQSVYVHLYVFSLWFLAYVLKGIHKCTLRDWERLLLLLLSGAKSAWGSKGSAVAPKMAVNGSGPSH